MAVLQTLAETPATWRYGYELCQRLGLKSFVVPIALALGLGSCNEESATNTGMTDNCYEGGCSTRDLPLVDGPDAPALLEVKLECQDHAVVLLATASDPQGTDNLRNILQTFGVYPDKDCQGTTLTVQDDFFGVGVEESFGDAVVRATHPALYDQICGCPRWPVQAQLIDADGNTTSGRVVANVTRP